MNDVNPDNADDWDAYLKGDNGGILFYNLQKAVYMCEAPDCDNFATMIWRRDQVIWYCGKHFMENQKLWTLTLPQHP